MDTEAPGPTDETRPDRADETRPDWTDDDLAGTGRVADMWWVLLSAGIDPLPAGLDALHDRVLAHRDTLAGRASFGERASAGTALLAALSAAGRAVHEAGFGPASHEGRVVGVFASGGGVPKSPVDRAEVNRRGLVGDRQAARRHHGRVWQALCLWSAEVIDELVAEGHGVFPGAAGENVTVAGVDWARLRPGARLLIGTALAEVTVPSLPCAKNARWFRDGDFNRMHHERHPGFSRLYAAVLTPGRVAVGDPVLVEP